MERAYVGVDIPFLGRDHLFANSEELRTYEAYARGWQTWDTVGGTYVAICRVLETVSHLERFNSK